MGLESPQNAPRQAPHVALVQAFQGECVLDHIELSQQQLRRNEARHPAFKALFDLRVTMTDTRYRGLSSNNDIQCDQSGTMFGLVKTKMMQLVTSSISEPGTDYTASGMFTAYTRPMACPTQSLADFTDNIPSYVEVGQCCIETRCLMPLHCCCYTLSIQPFC